MGEEEKEFLVSYPIVSITEICISNWVPESWLATLGCVEFSSVTETMVSPMPHVEGRTLLGNTESGSQRLRPIVILRLFNRTEGL